MKNTWLALLTIGFLTVVTFIFFFLRTQPIKLPEITQYSDNEELTEPTVTFVNPSKGPGTAKVTIVEFGDFQCDTCGGISTSIEAVRNTYPNDVRVVWKNFPNESLHPNSTPAAIAAHCADRQGKFWQYHDQLFLNQSSLSDQLYTDIAKELELDAQRFQDCVTSQDTLGIVQKDFEEARALNLSATPAIYLGKDLFVGYLDFDQLNEIVKARL